MAGTSKPAEMDGPRPDAASAAWRLFSPGGAQRVAALAALTIRDALRSRVLLAMTALACLFAAGSLLWPADIDRDRVILVQSFCFGTLTLFGLISAAFLAGSALPQDITSKRIYSLMTKPVSRLELLLGKTLGLLGVMFFFILVGGLITYVAAYIASARKTYDGGSYTIEVIKPSAEVLDEAGHSFVVREGQVLIADAKTGDGYQVTVAGRETGFSGTISGIAVRLHERSLAVRRVAQPEDVTSICTGRAEFSHNELLLLCSEFAIGDKWLFDLARLTLPAEGGEVYVRLRFDKLRYELPWGRSTHRKPHIQFLFRSPKTGQHATKELDFTFPGREVRPVPERGRPAQYYEETFTLPRSLLTGRRLEATVIDYEPKYPKTSRVYYDRSRSPTWHIRGLDPDDLPEGKQTLHMRFLVRYQSLDLVDAKLTAVIRNPVTHEAEKHELNLRNKTTSYIHFPRRLVDDREGVEVTFIDLGPLHRIGHASEESPMYLLLTPGKFWASTARSAFLVFLHLGVFIVLAVAVSTFVSSPVAILVTLSVALAGAVKGLIVDPSAVSLWTWPDSPFAMAARGQATLQKGVWIWITHCFGKMLALLAPGLEEFSSAQFINRGWSVPWSSVYGGGLYALVYTVLCFALGYAVFRSREFE